MRRSASVDQPEHGPLRPSRDDLRWRWRYHLRPSRSARPHHRRHGWQPGTWPGIRPGEPDDRHKQPAVQPGRLKPAHGQPSAVGRAQLHDRPAGHIPEPRFRRRRQRNALSRRNHRHRDQRNPQWLCSVSGPAFVDCPEHGSVFAARHTIWRRWPDDVRAARSARQGRRGTGGQLYHGRGTGFEFNHPGQQQCAEPAAHGQRRLRFDRPEHRAQWRPDGHRPRTPATDLCARCRRGARPRRRQQRRQLRLYPHQRLQRPGQLHFYRQ